MRRMTRKCGNCGRVKIFDMKYSVIGTIKVAGSYSRPKGVNEKIAIAEQGKPGRWRNYLQ